MLIKITLNLLLVILLLSKAESTHLPQQCYDKLVEDQTCNWYPLCLQEKFQCGKSGYPVGYGYKYCLRFAALKSFPKVRTWIDLTIVCLKQKLLPLLKQDTNITCHQLKKIAFESHPICYDQSGFCHLFSQLGFEDSLVFMRQLLGIFDLQDFLSAEAAKQVEEMGIKCIQELFFDLKNYLMEKLFK